jgi:kumamolisin
VVSTSWGQSETDIAATVAAGRASATYARSFDEAYLELAAQGQTSFTAAGDSGAYAASDDLGTKDLSVGNPGDSPWTTSAGGTTLAGSIPVSGAVSVRIPAERTWGWDWMWPYFRQFASPANSRKFRSEKAFITQSVVGGGGGFSTDEATPPYQLSMPGVHSFSAVPYLSPAGYADNHGLMLPTQWRLWAGSVSADTPAPAVVTGHRNGREVPDLAADGDPYTGYEVYFSGFRGRKLQPGWGGTSFVAPQLAGSAAVIDSYVGHRVGFWNPFIYRLAASRKSPFTPLDASGPGNDNLYYTGTKGNIYNVGSGLGTPDLARLAQAFASERQRGRSTLARRPEGGRG